MILLSCLAMALITLTMAGLSLHVPGALGIGSIELKTWFVALGGGTLGVYLAAVAIVTNRTLSRHAVWIVLAAAAILRLPLIGAPPFLSTDIYRYVWDGRVQSEGINPYRYVPAHPALESLRDDLVYPRINRAEYAPTIYPPMAEMVFGATGLIWPGVTGVKAVMVAFEGLTIFCLWHMLGMAGLPKNRLLIYAWNPLPIWSFAGNGHVDAAAIGLIGAALLLHIRNHNTWAGIALGGAILVKFLPAAIAPVLWRPRTGWRTAIAAVGAIALLYAVYSSVGLRVFGFLQGYGSEEGYDSGSGFWLLAGLSRLVPLPPFAATAYKAAMLALLLGVGAWVAFGRRRNDPVSVCASAALLMGVLTFAISPHYPWYFAWLALPSVVAPIPAVLWLSSAPILMYLDTFGDRFAWPSVVYVPALLLSLWRPGWRLGRSHG